MQGSTDETKISYRKFVKFYRELIPSGRLQETRGSFNFSGIKERLKISHLTIHNFGILFYVAFQKLFADTLTKMELDWH